MKKLFKRSLSLIIAIVVLMMSCLSVFAASDGYDGKTYSSFERAKCVVTRGNQYTYGGYTGTVTPQTYHYRVNNRTSYCVWSSNGSVTPVTATLGKYIISNSNSRAKAYYYLSWASSSSSPDKTTTGYYKTISSSFLSAYKKTCLAQYTTLNSKSTYQDVIVAALNYVAGQKKIYDDGEHVGTNGAYQYCMSHTLLDYLQQKSHNEGLGVYWTTAVDALVDLCSYLPSLSSDYRVFYIYPSGKSEQSLMSIEETPTTTGYAKVVKTSSNSELTDGNDCYSLKGAVYTIYSNSACTNMISEIETNANGTGTSNALEAGTYYIKETVAPPGYALDDTVHKITVTAEKTTTLSVTDTPQADPVAVVLQKRNATSGETVDWRMEGAEYTFSYYDSYYNTEEELQNVEPTRSWILKIDENNTAIMDSEHLVSGDGFFYHENFEDPILPLGTLTIQETKAPTGFYLDETLFIQQITSVGQDVIVNTYNTPVSDEYEIANLNIQVNKIWDDDDDRDGLRPESITVNLYRDEETEPIDTAVLSAENNWQHTFSELPEGCVDYDSETLRHNYEYTLSEVSVDGYETQSTGLVQDETDPQLYTCTFTNTHKPEKITVGGTKSWSDFDNIMGYRPDSITVHLYDSDDMNSSLQSVTVDADADWQYEFTDLYKYKNHGQEIQYTVGEDDVPHYNAVVDGMNITNKIKTGTITLKKCSALTQPLQGVQFELYTTDGEQLSVSQKDDYYLFAGVVSERTTTLITNTDGKVYIKNIPCGDFYFLETKTLEGYLPYEDKIPFTVEEGSEDTLNPSVVVRNNKILMYNTGGNGDSMFYIIAAIIGVFAFILFAIYIIISLSKKGKKNMKKLFSLVMAVLLIGAMMLTCIPGVSAANAALDTSAKTSFSFVCEKQGYEFSIYNVGSVVKSSNPYEVKYDSTIESLSDSILNGDSAALLSALDELSVSELGEVVGTYNTTTDGSTKEFTAQEQGIYYVRATNFPAGVREVTNSVFALPYYTAEDGWNYSLENIALAAKVIDDIPEIAKTITNSTKDNVEYTDVSLGDTVNYEIKSSKAGSYSNTASKDFRLNSYVIADKMAKGFTLDQDSFEVKLVDAEGNTVATLVRDTDYVVNVTAEEGKETEFTVALTTAYLQGTAFYSSTVSDVVTSYSAVLNKYATTAFEGNPNEAVSLTYSNKNDVTAVIDGNTVYAYTYGIEVNKQDENKTPLAGAQFALYKTEADAKAKENEVATGTSDANGLVEFKTENDEVIRLQSGTYYIVETVAPAGYNRYTDVIEVKVTAEYAETFTDGTWISSAPEDGVAVVTVTDSKVILPQTGGDGATKIYIVAAAGIALGLAFVAISRKRKSANTAN